MYKAILILLLVLAGLHLPAQPPAAPTRLRCDLLLNTETVRSKGMLVSVPLHKEIHLKPPYEHANIISTHPLLSWELSSTVKGTTAFRVVVASSPILLQSNRPDYWDSDKVPGTAARVVYGGKALLPGNVYYWKVQVWDQSGRPSPLSAASSFYRLWSKDTADFSHHPLAAILEYPRSITRHPDKKYWVDFGKDGFGQLYLQLNAAKSDSIWLEFAEAMDSTGQLVKTDRNIRYVRRGLWVNKGSHAYTIEWPANEKRNSRNPIAMPAAIGEVYPFRYVTVENFDGVLEKKSLQRKLVHYPFDDNAATFHCSDTVLNKVWDLCKYSIKATSFTGYYVDGDRERLPYEADALINQLSHYAVDAEYSMARRSLAYLLYHPTWPTEWSLQNISIAWNDYQYTGDKTLLQQYYGELQKKLLTSLAAPNGLISTTTGKQTDAFLHSIHMEKDFDGKHGLKDNVDWPQKGSFIGNEKEYGGETDGFVYCDYNSVINAWYYNALKQMRHIALVLDKPADATSYQQKVEQVYASFHKVFRNQVSGLVKDGDTTNHSSLHANMFALAFGLIPGKDKTAVTNFIKTRKMACSVYGAQFLLEALYDAGESEYALQLLTATTQRSWYNMLMVGATITMEAWDKVYKPNLDLNHAWGAAPANIIVRKLMGVESLTPGFDSLRIAPQFGGLQYASLTTPTIRGPVSVSWKKNDTQIQLEVVVPGATTAALQLPIDAGRAGWSVDGKPAATTPEARKVTIYLDAGKHTIVTQ